MKTILLMGIRTHVFKNYDNFRFIHMPPKQPARYNYQQLNHKAYKRTKGI